MYSCSYAHLNFWQSHPKHTMGKKMASSTNVAGKTGYLHAENWNLIYIFNPVQASTQSGCRTLI
jgi:hypothetical protein